MSVRVLLVTLLAAAGIVGVASACVLAGRQPAAAGDGPYRVYLPSLATAADEDTVQVAGDAAEIIYYVDCETGRDANDGRAPARAWRSLDKANAAAPAPGDQLRFKRGCSWTGPLNAVWHGTVERPIYIGAYGSGALPKIQDAYFSNVQIGGTYLIVDSLHATLSSPPNPDPGCRNQPVGWKAGFAFESGAAYSIVQNAQATDLAIGIFFSGDSHDNAAIHNRLTDNYVVWELTPNHTLGAMGVLLQGDRQEVGYNYFTGNRSLCTYTGVAESNSIELFAATNAWIHHNVAYGDRVFSELGSSASVRTQNNSYAYNLYMAGDDDSAGSARFLVTRGWNHPFGPVLNTQVYHNTVYLTDRDSKGITCGMCGEQILTLKNNILWVDREPFWSDGPFVEENNLYWSSDGRPLVLNKAFVMSPGSVVADPQFIDAAGGNFNLRVTSPALGRGAREPAAIGYDPARTLVEPDVHPDLGAYQFRTAPWRQVFALPGRIEAEDFRDGGEGEGYHDTTPANRGRAYRNEGVDLEPVADEWGGYDVGWIAAGEWLAYDVVVTVPGTYRITARVATPTVGNRFRIELDGQRTQGIPASGRGGAVTVPWTGGWQEWTDANVLVELAAGQYTLRFVAVTGGFNLDYLHVAGVR